MMSKKITKNANGITLIALVITIIIIVILATVAISFAFGQNGLIKRAQDAEGMYLNDTKYTEGSITNVQAYINDILIGKTEDEEGTTEPTEPDEPDVPARPTGTISFIEPQWIGDGTATVVISTDNTTDELQYQKNSTDGEWISINSGETITGLKHNDTVYSRLWNGTEGTDPASTSILDETPPEVEISASNVTGNSATLTVNASDGQSGLADTARYTYYLGDSFIVSNNTNTYTYTGLSSGVSYTLKVVVKDNAGKTTEKTTSITTVSLPTIEETLKEGDYVYYQDGTGQTRTCVVLYGPENANYSSYGIQIIPMDIVETFTIGTDSENNQTYINENINIYNDIINTLNNATSKYINTDYASSARCVGSMPGNPSYDASGMFSRSHYTYMADYNGRLKDSDENYLTDWNQMTALNVCNINKEYLLASRRIYASAGTCNFLIRDVISDDGIEWFDDGLNILTVKRSNTTTSTYKVTNGLRPVFTLKTGIKVTGGSGEETAPYTLGV